MSLKKTIDWKRGAFIIALAGTILITAYIPSSVSAVVDNAMPTAAEVGPSLSVAQQRAVLMGLLISGGMLVPATVKVS